MTPRHTPSDWRRLEEAFESASALQGSARAEFLAQLSDWPPGLRAELEQMLGAQAGDRTGAAAALEQPAVHALGFSLPGGAGAADWTGQVLGGRWKLESVIASGGMGDVLRARRVVGDYEQVVAVKLLREGFQHGSLARRFLAERRTLAALNHPHIARLLDGGETEAGIPWLVMEYVEGENVLDAADRLELDLNARVRLLLPICEALQHAHQRLIVHRDLKPGNILVRPDGLPVLLDFGIAKLLDPEESAEDLTQAAFSIFTPDYASPEQARGEAVGTASDLWSLGVVMHRLLAGSKPYSFEGLSRFELAQRLSTLALPPVRARLPGFPADLDAIIGMCLRVEPERRYPSALALEEDLQRFLRGLPVRAQPDRFAYRAQRFLRRNWAASLLGAATLLAAGAGAVGIVWQRDLAIRRADTAQWVVDFLVGLFKAPDPWAEGLQDQSLEQILAEGRRQLAAATDRDPEVRRELLTALGEVYRNLREDQEAIVILEEALSVEKDLRRRHPERWADIAFLLAVAHHRNFAYAESEPILREVLAIRRATPREDEELTASALNTLGATLAAQDKLDEAEALYRESLALRERLLGLDHEDLAATVQNLAELAVRRGELPEALREYERAAGILARAHPDGHPNRATVLNNWGMALRDAQDYPAAERALLEGLAMRQRLLPPDHPHVAGSLNCLGLLYYETGRTAEAATAWRTALAAITPRARPDHPLVLELKDNLAAAEEDLRAPTPDTGPD
jgi:serine/threonine-protein kinase